MTYKEVHHEVKGAASWRRWCIVITSCIVTDPGILASWHPGIMVLQHDGIMALWHRGITW